MIPRMVLKSVARGFPSVSAMERRRSPLLSLVALFLHGCVIPISSSQVTPTPAGTGVDASVGGTTLEDGAPSPTNVTGTADGSVPSGTWVNVTNNLANIPSECGNMSHLFVRPDGALIAGIAQRGLWVSQDGGNSWQAMDPGADGGRTTTITNRPTCLVFDPLNAATFWESGIYDGAGVFVTTDNGNTFASLGSVASNDLVSVDFSDPNRQTILVGAHETPRVLFRSTDGGMTFTNIGANLPDGSYCTLPILIDSQVHLVGCYGGTGTSGIYRTPDGGATWANVSTSGGGAAPLRASDGSIYWVGPSDQGLTRSTDDGQTWIDTGVAPFVLSTTTPVELPDGRIATIGASHAIVASGDHGKTWNLVSTVPPYLDASGLIYSKEQKAFYIWHSTCGFDGPIPVPTDAILRYDFDYAHG
jgi:photosystem II stability/assembly factor-like uncharacterized protein